MNDINIVSLFRNFKYMIILCILIKYRKLKIKIKKLYIRIKTSNDMIVNQIILIN